MNCKIVQLVNELPDSKVIINKYLLMDVFKRRLEIYDLKSAHCDDNSMVMPLG